MKNKSLNREIVVQSATKNLAVIRNFMQLANDEFGISEETAGKIMLSVDEACTNIIKHAYKETKNGEIIIQFHYSPKEIEIIIKDNGKHFNPNNIPEPDLAKYQKQKKVGGLGMFLMKKLMDKVTYETLSNGTNKLTMVKNLL